MASGYRFARRVPQNPPPVPKKPSLQERQRRSELRAAMEGQQPPFQPPAPPPPIGYNDADRFYMASPPPPSDSSLELDQELEIFPQKLGSRPANEPQASAWLSKKLNKMEARNGDKQHGAPRVPTNAQTDTKDLINDEESRRRRMEEQLGDLKAENRAKSRELKTNKYIENEMNRKLKTADDAYVLRHTVKDKDREIANQDKIIAELTAENAKLAEDLAERDRHVFALQSEVDNLDRVILAKKALREAERLQTLSEDLDKTRDELAGANFENETAKNELKNSQSVVSRKDREIKNKSDQIEQLTKQLALAEAKIASLENEKAIAENHSKAANREAKLLKEQKDKLVDVKERCHNLEEENAYMADAIKNLEAKVQQLESVKHDKEVLQELVQDLKSALKDKNQIAKDRRNLMIEAQQLKELLREKTIDEEALQKELEKIKDVLSELEKENSFYRDLEVDFRRVKEKYEEVEKERFKNELVLAKLRPRVERLQSRCKEKDDLIRRLANELRTGGDRFPRDLLQEADRNQSNAVNDYVDLNDYLEDNEPLSAQVRRSRDRRPFNSSTTAYEPVKGMRRRSPSPSRPYEQARTPSYPRDRFSQQKLEQVPSKEVPQHEEVRRVQQAPSRSEPRMESKSPSRYNDAQHPTRQEPVASRVPPPTAWEIPHQGGSPDRRGTGPGQSEAAFEEAIRPRKREDDETVSRLRGYDPMRLNNMDNPENYAREEPVRQYPRQPEQANPQRFEQVRSPTDALDHQKQRPNQRAERVADGGQKPDLVRSDTYSMLNQPTEAGAFAVQNRDPVPEVARNVLETQQQQPQPEQYRQPEHNPQQQERHQQLQQRTLDPPTNVRAQMQPESDSLVVEWDTPVLDELDRNNGVVVSGYKVFINGTEQQPVVSSRVRRSIVPRATLGDADVSALAISVQAYSHDGQTSDRANLSVAPNQPAPGNQHHHPRQGPTSPLTVQVDAPMEHQPADQRDQKPSEYNGHSPRDARKDQLTDDRFRTRDNSPAGAASRLGLLSPQPFARKAMYDYQPSEHSPSTFPPYELEMRKGEEVHTFGPVRPDGMYNAEVNGKRGLVPAQYLQME